MMNKNENILNVLSSNYNMNLFSEMNRIHIAEQIVNALDNKAMPEFGDDVITEERAKEMEKSKPKPKPKNRVSKIRSKAKKINK